MPCLLAFLLERSLFYFVVISFLIFTSIDWVHGSSQTALADYVFAEDGSYCYSVVDAPVAGHGYKTYLLHMVSQRWRSMPGEVDRELWTHWMNIIVPDEVVTDTAVLSLADGDDFVGSLLNSADMGIAVTLALKSRSIVAVMGQIPNQPLGFASENYRSHSEDDLVAHSWSQAMDELDWQWPVYLPMTKAVVRAMDTVQSFISSRSVRAVERFVVTGGSKRGAATWLAGAVDSRVRAIAPIAFDMLDIDAQIEHHFSAYGFYSSALNSYESYGLLERLRTPEGQELLAVVDPLSYVEQLIMPKFLLNSPGDQFFLPDATRFYFDQLPGENLLRYVANTDHSLEGGAGDKQDALMSWLGWYQGLVSEVPRPSISWVHDGGELVVTTDQMPLSVRLWQADNPDARDFRTESIGRTWRSLPLTPVSEGVYSVAVPQPRKGWSAYFIDLTYPGVVDTPQTYSTSVFVSPDTLPFSVPSELGNPRSARFWKRQVKAVLKGKEGASVPSEQLRGYLPIPFFDEPIVSLEQVSVILAGKDGRGEGNEYGSDYHSSDDDDESNNYQRKAKRECFALRLNIRHQQIGWHTLVNLNERGEKKVWEHYAQAHDSYLAGDAKDAKKICSSLNRL